MLRIGDQVAVLVTPNEVRQIAKIVHVGPAVVELDNRGLYFLDDGKAMHDVTYIKPATDEHRAAKTSATCVAASVQSTVAPAIHSSGQVISLSP